MGRKAIYTSGAERQMAYRQRVALGVQAPVPSKQPMKQRKPNRPARLRIIEAEVTALLSEYEAWDAQLPEALQDTVQAERLADTIERLETVAQTLAEIDPPLGFGRD